MSEHIFLFEPHGDNEQHSVIKADRKEANEITESGKGIRVDFSEYEGYRTKAKQLHSDFRKREQRIKASDDPRDTDEVKRYELDKLAKQYQADSKALEDEYQKFREKAIDEARSKAARAKVNVTDSDKATAEQLANRLALTAQMSLTDEAKSLFASEAEADIKRLTDEEKVALQAHIGKVLDKLDEPRQQRRLINAVQSTRNFDRLAAKAAEQLPYTANLEYKQVKTARRWR